MRSHPEFTADLTGFTGTVPMFPLPNVVLFPYVALPLHIFEPRYRELVADALEEDRLIALALLKSGWEPLAGSQPAIHEMVCLGRITAEERLPDGKYNIVLTGLHRAVVVEELHSDRPYRMARLELYRDFYASAPLVNRDSRYRELLLNFRKLFSRSRADSLFNQVLDADLPLGVLCDLLAAALRIETSEKQAFLEELDIDLRSDLVLDKIRELLPVTADTARRSFPPKFSLN